MWTFNTFISDDIEVLVEVTSYVSVPGSFSFNAASDADYYGYDDINWVILDLNSDPISNDLRALITQEDEDRINDEALDYMEKWAKEEAAIDRYEASRDNDYYYD